MMNTKQDRQTTIRQLVENGRVATQQDLLRALRKRRMPVDQSTLSRDLAELGVHKAGGRYVAAEATVIGDAGAYNYTSNKVMGNANLMVTGPYEIPNCHIDTYGITTNNIHCFLVYKVQAMVSNHNFSRSFSFLYRYRLSTLE